MITKKHLSIIAELRQNSRQHISGIARKLNEPASTVHDCYNSLSCCIKRFTTLIDFEKLGYGLRVNFTFRIRGKSILDSFLLKSMSINSIFRIDNKNTLLAECIFTSMAEAYDFKEKLQELGAKSIDMRHISEEIKREGFLSKSSPENFPPHTEN